MEPDASPFTAANGPALRTLAYELQARHYGFIAVTPATHRTVNARPGNETARTLADIFGWNRPFAADLLGPLFAPSREAGLIVETPHGWCTRVRAATLGDVLALHSGYPTDAADAVFFGPDTYRFHRATFAHLEGRPPPRRVLELCCGAGAVGIAVARALPEATVLLADINPAACVAARINAAAAAAPRVTCRQGDLFAGLDGPFDLVIANPPFLADATRRTYRHGGGPLGQALSLRIVREGLGRLAPGGSLLLYTASAICAGEDGLRAALAGLLRGTACRWDYRELDPDIFGEELSTPAYAEVERIAAVVLTVIRPVS